MLSFTSSLSSDCDAFTIFVTERYDYKDKKSILSNNVAQKINSFLEVLKVKKNDEELSSFDIARRNYTHVMWFILENDFFQYSQGLMPDNMWAAKLNTIRLFYNQCDTRESYLTRKNIFSREFIREVESIPDECRE